MTTLHKEEKNGTRVSEWLSARQREKVHQYLRQPIPSFPVVLVEAQVHHVVYIEVTQLLPL